MYIEGQQLDDFIKDSGLIPRPEFETMAKKAKEKGTSVSQILLAEGKMTEDDLRKVQAHVLGIPFVDLKAQKIDFEVLSLIPEPVARNHNIVPYKRTPEALEVAMLDTDDLAAIEFVKKKVRLKILPRLTDMESIKSALLQYQKSLKAEFGDIIQEEAGVIKSIAEGKGEEFFDYLGREVAYFVGGGGTTLQTFKTELGQRNIRLITDETEFKITVRAQVNRATKVLEAWVSLTESATGPTTAPKQGDPNDPNAQSNLFGSGGATAKKDPGLKISFLRIL
jgi:hypothetical protein